MSFRVCKSAFGVHCAIIAAQLVLLACTAGGSERLGTASNGSGEGGTDNATELGPEASADQTDGSVDSLSDATMDDGADVELPFDICPDGGCVGDAPGPGCGPGESLYYTLPGCGVGPVCRGQTRGNCTQAFCGCDGVAFLDNCGAAAQPFQVYSACVTPDSGCPSGSCFVRDPSDAAVCARPHDWVMPLVACIGEGGSD